uniref:Leucine rich immune protein (Coil-less) n=1 Tax=Anopheles epiroticus TaxID=199890 RepID=A0A182PQH4_9DIPT
MVTASALFADITFQQYHEQALTITSQLSSESLELLSAPRLTQLIVVPNQYLRKLYLVNSALRRIPETLMLGSGNNITRIEFELLDLGGLLTIYLDANQLQTLPTFSQENMPNLQRVYLDGNQLTVIDLAAFQDHQQLEGFHFSSNRLRSVTTTQPVILPMLLTMELADNELESFSLANCSFPHLEYLLLKGNRLQLVPVEIFNAGTIAPTITINMQNNPLSSVA